MLQTVNEKTCRKCQDFITSHLGYCGGPGPDIPPSPDHILPILLTVCEVKSPEAQASFEKGRFGRDANSSWAGNDLGLCRQQLHGALVRTTEPLLDYL